MRPAYGILDLFTLVAKLLAPFVDPMRAEFEPKAMGHQRPSTRPQPEPEPTPAREPATPIANAAVVMDTHAVNAPAEVPSPEPLFVRIGSGRGARYRLDDGHTPGDRFRRRVKNGRPKYEPAR